MVHIKGYSFNTENNENNNQKKFFIFEKEIGFINLYILTVELENNIISLNLYNYYSDKKYELIKNIFSTEQNFNSIEKLYQLSKNNKLFSYYDGENILFIDLEKTTKNKKIFFIDNKIKYNNNLVQTEI